MALSHVELYEALKGSVGERAAALIADVVPPAGDLATKSDVVLLESELRGEIAGLRTEVREGFAQIRTLRWMMGLSLPIWVGTWATFVLILLKK